jgi:hypothetical protein
VIEIETALVNEKRIFPVARKLGRSAISKCLEEIDAAMKNGTVDAARKYRGELEPAASLPSVWGDQHVAAALWNAYDLSGRWVDGAGGVTAREAIDAVEAAIRTLNDDVRAAVLNFHIV